MCNLIGAPMTAQRVCFRLCWTLALLSQLFNAALIKPTNSLSVNAVFVNELVRNTDKELEGLGHVQVQL